MERIVLTIGYVPEDNSLDIIYCGDSDSSGTMELNFEVVILHETKEPSEWAKKLAKNHRKLLNFY